MKKALLMLLAVLLCSTGLFANGKSDDSSSAADSKSGGVLVFGRSNDAVSLDPGCEDDGESFYPIRHIYQGLVSFKAGTTEPEPCLAESWDVTEGGLVYTFHLREGVKFSDGTDMNADAVVFSFERQFKEDNPAFSQGPWKYWGYMDMDNIIDSVVAVDDLTVKMTLKKVEAPLLNNLCMEFASIVSPAASDKYGDDFRNNPVGTGPFMLASWTKGDSIVVERNPYYWGEGIHLDRIIFKVIPDATARWLALQKGEVDVIDLPSPEDLDAIRANADVDLVSGAGLNVGYLALNTAKKPFDNKLVRQAINYAINKEDIIKGVYGDSGQAAKNPIPPTMWGYNDDIVPYEYNPAKAKELLAEAGYPNGFDTELWAMPVVRSYNPNAKKMAEIMQAQLKEVGINCDIVSYEWGTYLDKTDVGEHEMALLGWGGDNGDPDNFLWVLLSEPAATPPAGNIAFWKNAEFTALCKEAKETADMAKRTELYKQAQVIFHEECPWVPVAHSTDYVAMKKNVKGFVMSPLARRELYRCYLED